MTEYRCYFFNTGGHIIAAEDIVTERDDDALLRAKVGFAANAQYSALELWQGQRRIHHEARGSAPKRTPED